MPQAAREVRRAGVVSAEATAREARLPEAGQRAAVGAQEPKVAQATEVPLTLSCDAVALPVLPKCPGSSCS